MLFVQVCASCHAQQQACLASKVWYHSQTSLTGLHADSCCHALEQRSALHSVSLSDKPNHCIILAFSAGLFDAQKEQQRLQKQQAKLEKDLQMLQGRLQNPKFVQNAKPEVVKEVQQSAAEGEQKLAQIQEKMQQIAHLI